jgi:hypothetical protein
MKNFADLTEREVLAVAISSEEIATASTSRSVKSAKFFIGTFQINLESF